MSKCIVYVPTTHTHYTTARSAKVTYIPEQGSVRSQETARHADVIGCFLERCGREHQMFHIKRYISIHLKHARHDAHNMKGTITAVLL